MAATQAAAPVPSLDEAVAGVLAVVRRGKHRAGTSSTTYARAKAALDALEAAAAACDTDAAVPDDLPAVLLACSRTMDAGAVQAVLTAAAHLARTIQAGEPRPAALVL